MFDMSQHPVNIKSAENTIFVCFSKVQTLNCKKKKNFKHSNRKITKVETPNLYFFQKKKTITINDIVQKQQAVVELSIFQKKRSIKNGANLKM